MRHDLFGLRSPLSFRPPRRRGGGSGILRCRRRSRHARLRGGACPRGGASWHHTRSRRQPDQRGLPRLLSGCRRNAPGNCRGRRGRARTRAAIAPGSRRGSGGTCPFRRHEPGRHRYQPHVEAEGARRTFLRPPGLGVDSPGGVRARMGRTPADRTYADAASADDNRRRSPAELDRAAARPSGQARRGGPRPFRGTVRGEPPEIWRSSRARPTSSVRRLRRNSRSSTVRNGTASARLSPISPISCRSSPAASASSARTWR